MDFLEFQRNPELAGLKIEDIEDFQRETAIVVWAENKDKGGVIATHKSGRKIFPQNDYYLHFSKEEAWVCKLKLYGDVYKATPIQRIDASFFYNLKSDQVDDIVDQLWEKRQSLLQPMVEAKMAEELAEIERQSSEKYAKELERLKAEIDRLKDESASDKRIIDSLQKNIGSRTDGSKVETPQSESSPHNNFSQPQFFDSTPRQYKVQRESEDVIQSDFFVRSRYFVHVSKDGKLMSIRPHESGTAICIDGSITLFGLGEFFPYDGVREYDAISDVEGGLIVRLA